jgi:hypothetical protein
MNEMNEIIEEIQVEKEINEILLYELKKQQDHMYQILQSLNKFNNDQTDELTENQHQNNLTKLQIIQLVAMKLTSKSSIHGFPKIISKGNKLIQAAWAFLTITAISICIVMIINIRDEYYNYDVITQTKSITERSSIFPSIIICMGHHSGNISEHVNKCAFKTKQINITKPDFDFFDDFNYLNKQ